MSTNLPLRYGGIQKFDIIPTVKNMTKYAVMLTDPLSVREEISKAICIALEGRRGSVWIDVPLDIQSAMVDVEKLYEEDFQMESVSINKSQLTDMFDVLKGAQRPCILGGTGVVSANV